VIFIQNRVNIKQIRSEYTLTLHKVNKDYVGQFPLPLVDTLSRKIDSSDELEITVPKYVTNRITLKPLRYSLFDEIRNERYICLDNKEYFVIKDIQEDNDGNKVIKATSGEIKLSRISFEMEDMGVQLFTGDEDAEIISLNEYMKEETGWSLGEVDDSLGYETIINDDGEEEVKERVRWQESQDSNWHDFLTTNIKEQFSCIVQFDTYNRKVNLYEIDSFGDNLELILSRDNYIKSLEKTSSSTEITTRLKMVGEDEMDIIGATVTGYPYLENYSYFIKNGEMSKDLTKAMLKYIEMNEIREKLWKEQIETKNVKQKEVQKQKDSFMIANSMIKSLENVIKIYEEKKDDINRAKAIAEMHQYSEQRDDLEESINTLENHIAKLDNEMMELTILCKRETATDENDDLIFNDILLEELKEFIYCDTYNDDSFLKVEDFIAAGKRKLELKCRPAVEWSIDSVNFLSRLLDTGFRKHWQGNLSLGDVIMLYDREEDTEDLIYFVGYTQNFKDNTLKIDLSNKKTKEDDIRTIADYLTKSKHTLKSLNKKKYLLNRQKYNRINVPESEVVR
jgi:PAS domain-containing protein